MGVNDPFCSYSLKKALKEGEILVPKNGRIYRKTVSTVYYQIDLPKLPELFMPDDLEPQAPPDALLL